MPSPLRRPVVYARLCCYLGAALLIAAGCGNSSPAAGTGNGGSSAGGASATGTGGASAAGTAGTTGSGGSSTTGTAGATGSGGSNVTGAGGRGGTGTGSGGVTGRGGTGVTGTGGSSTGAGGTLGPGGCDPNGPQCNNCKDDDGDGKIDYADPECVGGLDNDESSFGTGISGDNMDACKQDCFFDGNSGMGDDHCLWQLKCDPVNTGGSCPYDANYAASHATECSVSASQSQACVDFCRKLVPNGCDCFGCCAIPNGPTIRLAPTCTAANFNDPVKCPPCTQVTQCANTCGHCEICIGKPTLPADCAPDGGTDGGTDGPPPPQCDSDYPIACGPGTNVPADSCPTGLACITGCCGPLP